jgi:hypothetical protein
MRKLFVHAVGHDLKFRKSRARNAGDLVHSYLSTSISVFDLSGGLGGLNPPSSKPRPPQLSQKKVVGGVEITPPPVI